VGDTVCEKISSFGGGVPTVPMVWWIWSVVAWQWQDQEQELHHKHGQPSQGPHEPIPHYTALLDPSNWWQIASFFPCQMRVVILDF
jgi:hypothetical protein